jgi:dTDP-4-dehydrorhamnose reductase|tara:strand:+ start:733 stop:1608 length:876 start_codon:yes stop_codon:yes gene_type:complete
VKVLITGADGQLGSTFVRVLGDSYEVVGTVRHELDLTNDVSVRAVVSEVRPDLILNCAAYNEVDSAERCSETALAVNAFGVQSLAVMASECHSTLVHFSTDFVFDGNTSLPYSEADTPNPQSVYAVSKLLGEWFAALTPRYYVIRVESLFGGVTSVNNESHRSSLDLLADALLENRTVRAFTDRVVSPSYVEDVAEATTGILTRGLPSGLYHCVGSGSASWFNIVTELAAHLETDTPIQQITLENIELPAKRPKFSALSNRKLASAGVVIPSWQDAVSRYANERLKFMAKN